MGSVIIFESSKFISKRQLAEVILILWIIFFLSFTRYVDSIIDPIIDPIARKIGTRQCLRKVPKKSLSFCFPLPAVNGGESFRKHFFPTFSKLGKGVTDRILNRSNGAQYRFQIFIASPLPPRPRRVGTRKWKRALLVAAAVCPRF